MFKRIISTQGFWKSVVSLGVAFSLIFVIIKWGLESFNKSYFSTIQNPTSFMMGLLIGGFIYGFIVTYGKFRGKLKKNEERN